MIKEFVKHGFPIISLMILWACNKKNNSTQPIYKSLTEAVYASGNVYPESEYKIIANADGYLLKSLVSEGDMVQKNQLLFQIESSSQRAQLESSGKIYAQSNINYSDNSPILLELSFQMKSANIRVQNDSATYFRNQDLYEKKALTKAELDRSKFSYEGSRADYLARKNAWQRAKNMLYVDLQNAKSNFKVNEQTEANYQIRAFETGKIFELNKKKGELIRRGDVMGVMANAKQSFIQLAIDETDIAKLKIGQEVWLKIDIYDDKIFKAQITKIYPKLNKADQTFRADAEFVGDAPENYYGLSVEANILISANNKALVIPKNYLIGGDSVLTKIDGKKQKVRVQKGIENLDFVEIKNGLTDKSEIFSDN